MKKDKEWLLREFRKLTFELQNGYAKVKAVDILPLIDQLDEPKKPIIPQFLSDWIEHCKENNLDLYEAFGHSDMSVEVSDFIGDMDADEFARAWLDYPNIEVEKEKLYYIKFSENQYAQRFDGTKIDSILINDKSIAGKFTKEEIEKMNSNFMALAVEVAE